MKRNTYVKMLRSPRKDRSAYSQINDEEFETVPMGSAKRVDLLEREVRPDDTLHSIALEFNVSVADLKRVNNIHKDNEIFARNIIKIPHKPYSLLLESDFFKSEESDLAGPSTSSDASPLSGPSTSSPPAASRDEAAIIVDLVNSSGAAPSILLSEPTTPQDDDGDETDVLLLDGSPVKVTPLHCNGADGDLSWGFLLTAVLCIGIGGPAAYVWYFWCRLEKCS